ARSAPPVAPPMPPAQDPRAPAFILETPLAGAPRTPPAPGMRTPYTPSPPRPASSPSSSPQTDAGLRSRQGFAASPPMAGMSSPSVGARPRVSNPGMADITPSKPLSDLESPGPLLTGPRLLLAAIALLAIATVAAGGVFLLASAPPDRSSPSATVS